MLTLICYNDGGAKRSVSDVESGSKLQVQKGLTQSSKLWLNLCSFKWLNPNLNLVSNLIPDGLWILYKGLSFGLISLNRWFMKTEYGEFRVLIFIPLSDGPRKKWKFESISSTLISCTVIDIPSYVFMWFLRY